jgi:subtilisin
MKGRITRRTVLRGVAAGVGVTGVGRRAAEVAPPERHVVGTATSAGHAAAVERATAVVHEYDFGELGGAVAARLPPDAVETLRGASGVRYVERDAPAVAAQRVPWNLEVVGAPAARTEGSAGASVDVAVLDTGIDADHPDLVDNLGAGRAFVACGEGSDCSATCAEPWDDPDGHGTHVAGTIGAVANDQGVLGVAAPTLHAVKVLDCDGMGSTVDIAKGVEYVADQGWDVANLSLGTTTDSFLLADACRYAYERGVLLVAAAGNAGCADCVEYPAAYREVIAVSATTAADTLGGYSNTGPEIELAAPGGGDANGNGGIDVADEAVYSTAPGDEYEYEIGTSMAAAHVAGAAAHLLGAGLNHAESVTYSGGRLSDASYERPGGVRGHLRKSATDVGLTAAEGGAGRLDVTDAVADLAVVAVESDDGSPVRYELEVDRNLQKSTAPSASINSGDTVDGTVATGFVAGWRDGYSCNGIERFAALGDATLFVDGDPVDPTAVVSRHTLTVEAVDGGLSYEFAADGATQVDALGASINDGDAVAGGVVSGGLGPGRDSYTYTGGLRRFAATDGVVAYRDGRRVDLTAAVDRHTLVVVGTGDSVEYSLEVDADLERSGALASVNDADTVDGTTASGVVRGGRDAYEFTGDLRTFTTAGNPRVVLDGTVVDPAAY